MARRDVLAGLMVLAGLAGIGVSIYLTGVHYSAIPLACTTSGAINCEVVLSSGYGVIAGTALPTSAAGILWFAVSGALAFGQTIRPASRPLALAQAGWAAIGLVTVVYLVFVEIVMLGAVCIWCTAAHALVVATFLLAIARWQSTSELT